MQATFAPRELISPPELKLSEGGMTIIVAMDNNNCIGKQKSVLWHLKDNIKFFRETTLNKEVVLGSVTQASIVERLGHTPTDRTNIVMTTKKELKFDGCKMINSPKYVFEVAKHRRVFIIGGGQIYKLFLPYVNRMIVTHVDTTVENGDTFFPEINWKEWRTKLLHNHHKHTDRNDFDFYIAEYTRNPIPRRLM